MPAQGVALIELKPAFIAPYPGDKGSAVGPLTQGAVAVGAPEAGGAEAEFYCAAQAGTGKQFVSHQAISVSLTAPFRATGNRNRNSAGRFQYGWPSCR